MTPLRAVAAALILCTVILIIISTRNPAADPPPAPDYTALSVTSCGGGAVAEVTEQAVFCAPDQQHSDVKSITAGDMIGRLMPVIVITLLIFAAVMLSNLWNGVPG